MHRLTSTKETIASNRQFVANWHVNNKTMFESWIFNYIPFSTNQHIQANKNTNVEVRRTAHKTWIAAIEKHMANLNNQERQDFMARLLLNEINDEFYEAFYQQQKIQMDLYREDFEFHTILNEFEYDTSWSETSNQYQNFKIQIYYMAYALSSYRAKQALSLAHRPLTNKQDNVKNTPAAENQTAIKTPPVPVLKSGPISAGASPIPPSQREGVKDPKQKSTEKSDVPAPNTEPDSKDIQKTPKDKEKTLKSFGEMDLKIITENESRYKDDIEAVRKNLNADAIGQILSAFEETMKSWKIFEGFWHKSDQKYTSARTQEYYRIWLESTLLSFHALTQCDKSIETIERQIYFFERSMKDIFNMSPIYIDAIKGYKEPSIQDKFKIWLAAASKRTGINF